jgi:hypothetical protein
MTATATPSATNNLWGIIDLDSTPVAPVTLLKEQAAILSQMTKGRLVGEVRSGSNSNGSQMNHDLVIRVPAMGNYMAKIFTIYHGPTLYPLIFKNWINGEGAECADQSELENLMAQCLQSEPTRKLIAGLLASANAVDQ